MEVSRICKKCKEKKNLEDFVKTKACNLGYRYECKKCHNKKYVLKGSCKDNPSWFKKGHGRIPGSEKGWFKKGHDNSKAAILAKGRKSHNFIDGKSREKANELRNKLNAGKIKKLRFIALERDNHKCLVCQKEDKRLHMHHKIPIRLDISKAYNLDNVIMLCAKCHASEEKKVR